MSILAKTSTKRNPQNARCKLTPEAQILREFRRERYVICERCHKCKTHQSMAIERVLCVGGKPTTWAYAICQRCVRSHPRPELLLAFTEYELSCWWMAVRG